MARDFPNGSQPTMAALVGGIVNDVQVLLKEELQLAKCELANQFRVAKQAIFALAVGVAIAVFGALLLVFMLVYLLHWALSERLPVWSCFGIVGAVLTILGTALFSLGKRRARQVRLLPPQTIATMKDNVAWITKQTSEHNGPTRSATG
jgi:uncharacterized membrane protein YqjE